MAIARPSGMRDRGPQRWQRPGDGRFHRFVEARHPADFLALHFDQEIGARDDAESLMQGGELLDRDGARFKEPAQVGRQVGDCRFQEHPASSVVHVPQLTKHLRIASRWRSVEERTEIAVRPDRVGSDERGCLGKEGSARGVPADSRKCGELIERAMQRNRGGSAGSVRNRRASLSVRLVQAEPAWVRLWFQSADWLRASLQCRP